jgi:hypothetical protein
MPLSDEMKEALDPMFRTEVDLPAKKDADNENILDESCFHSLTIGWALAKGLTLDDSYDYVTYVRYHTDMG